MAIKPPYSSITSLLALTSLFSSSTTASTTPRFTQFFPHFAASIDSISTTECSTSLAAYHANPSLSTCNPQLNCILTNLDETTKADIACAGIILGLAPIIIASLGPSVAEIALLSTRRPLLSFLLSVGAPAVFVSRPMEYADPLELLEPVRGRFTFGAQQVGRGVLAAVISVGEYALVMAAIANLITATYSLGFQTVLVWRCDIAYLPVAWALLPIVIHFVATTTWIRSMTVRMVRKEQENEDIVRLHRSRQGFSKYLSKPLGWVLREPVISANHAPYMVNGDDEPEVWAVAFNQLAGLMGYTHVIFGLIVFSSLSLIATVDAVRVIARIFASTIMCRLVLIVETAGLRGSLELRKGSGEGMGMGMMMMDSTSRRKEGEEKVDRDEEGMRRKKKAVAAGEAAFGS